MMVRFVVAAAVLALAAAPAAAAADPPSLDQDGATMSVTDAWWSLTTPAEGWVRVQYATDATFADVVCDTGWFLTGFHQSASWGAGEPIWFAESCGAPDAPGSYHWRAAYGEGGSYEAPADESPWSDALAFELTAAPGEGPPPEEDPGSPPEDEPGPVVDPTDRPGGEELDPALLEELLSSPETGPPGELEVEDTEPLCGGEHPEEDNEEALQDLAAARAIADATVLSQGALTAGSAISSLEGFAGCTTRTPPNARCKFVTWNPVLSYGARILFVRWTLYRFSVQNHFCYDGTRVYEVFGTEWTWDRLNTGVYVVRERSRGHSGYYYNQRAAHRMEHHARLEFCIVLRLITCTTDYYPLAWVDVRADGRATPTIVRYR
jgi:hypothetical protein